MLAMAMPVFCNMEFFSRVVKPLQNNMLAGLGDAVKRVNLFTGLV
jgi:hypothetical protein